jgi:hypothetical protein
MDKNDSLPFWKNNVRFARQRDAVKSESKSHAVKHTSDRQLGFRMCLLDGPHYLGSFFGADRIHLEPRSGHSRGYGPALSN